MAHIAIIHFYWNRLCPVKDADPGGEVSFDSVRLHQSHVTEKGQYFDKKSRPDRPSGPIKYAGSGLMKSIRDVMIRTAGPPLARIVERGKVIKVYKICRFRSVVRGHLECRRCSPAPGGSTGNRHWIWFRAVSSDRNVINQSRALFSGGRLTFGLGGWVLHKSDLILTNWAQTLESN